MKVTFLGTGTSQGVPVIGCNCDACTSTDPRDNRFRTAVLVEVDHKTIVIDIGPDFRQQMLTARVTHLDAVLLTHEHNDHMIGADDLRPFNFRQRKDMPIFGEGRVLEEIKQRFKYAFLPHPYPGIPQFQLLPILPDEEFFVEGIRIVPIRLYHGSLPIFGFRIGDFCYLTDTKTIPSSEFKKLEGIDTLVLNALRKKQHHSHLTIEEAILLSQKINPRQTFFTHFSHDLGPVTTWEQELPETIYPAHDGLVIEIM